jgi:heparinase II/III-like protein
MPPAEKQRLLDHLRSNKAAHRQFEAMKTRAEQGKFVDAALEFALEGNQKAADVVRRHLLEHVRSRTASLDADIAAGGHRENNMEFYWDTADIRAYDLVYSVLTSQDRETIEAFYRKLGRYWKDSLSRWTTTPNLVFPIHYHAAVIGFCVNDEELIEWGLRDSGGRFGPTRGGLFPVLDAMLRDGAIWDEATIYAAVNVLQPMMQLAILHKLYDGKDLFGFESSRGASIKKLVDGYIALTYPRERTGVGPGSFQIATYGDGSTENPHAKHHNTDAIYLVNLPWTRENYRHEIIDTIEQAYYLSRDPKYAWFLSHEVEREPLFLYGESIPFGSVGPPPAPSSIFPEAGIAMLRADESPNYWTNGSIAVLQMMARGYGHDHRDKLEIVMHAGGRLLYPDLNCVQYESPSINWTANSIAHNTLVVDRGKTANAPFTYRHEFTPEVEFLATSASCYPGVLETRALALTREYLLDLFWAESELPHTYDWVLHAIGRLHLENPAAYHSSSDLLRDYWWIENERQRETAQSWRADFIQQNGFAIRGMGRQTDEWFKDRAAVRVTMIGEPGTTVYGAEGPTGGPPVDPLMNPEGNSPLLLVRRECRQTVFAAVHEPYKFDAPAIVEVRKAAAIEDAYLAEVRARDYVDRVAITFGERKSNVVHALRNERNMQELFVFSNYGYLRETTPKPGAQPSLAARGFWTGFRMRCPQLPERGALTVNGTNAPYRREGDCVVYGDISKTPESSQQNPGVIANSDSARSPYRPSESIVPLHSLEILALKDPIRLAVRGSRQVTLELRNGSAVPQSGRVSLNLPGGVLAEPSDVSTVAREERSDRAHSFSWALPTIAANQTTNISLRMLSDGAGTPGLYSATAQVTGTTRTNWTAPIALPITIGPVLVEDNSFPTFGEYVIYAPRYTFRMSKRYGTSRFLHDDANRPRFEATFWDRRPTAATTPEAIPRLRVNDQDALAWGEPAQFLWPNTAPASITVGTGRSRLTWSFEDDAVRIEPVALWSVEAPHEFIFPGGRFGWTAWGDRPQWTKIIAFDERGQEQSLTRPATEARKILGAALEAPGYEEVICFAVDRPQTARFQEASIRITVSPGEPLWFGLATPDEFDKWMRSRRKK